MTSPTWQSSTARDEPARRETAGEPMPAEVSVPAPALPSRPLPAGVHAAKWVPPDPETLRRVKAALDRL
jgi:hypothetical protein